MYLLYRCTFNLLVLILLAFPSAARAAIYETQAALEQGQNLALDPMFDSVGYVSSFDDLGEFFRGSGVLIDPHWVLTAGHNLIKQGTGITPQDAVGFSLNQSWFDVPTNVIMSDAFYVFPGYTADASPGTNTDIGLMHLVDPIFDVLPAERFRGTDEPGKHVYAAGYGDPGVWPNIGDFDGLKRAGENVVDCFGCLAAVDAQYMLADFGPDWFTPVLPMEWQSSPGDSGGAWLAELDGRMQLVGINTFTRGNNNLSGAIRVSLYNDWIDETMALHTEVPEPSTFVMFGLGMLSLGCHGWLRRERSLA